MVLSVVVVGGGVVSWCCCVFCCLLTCRHAKSFLTYPAKPQNFQQFLQIIQGKIYNLDLQTKNNKHSTFHLILTKYSILYDLFT